MRKIKFFITIFTIALLLFLFFGKEIFDFYSKLTLQLPEIKEDTSEVVKNETEKEVSLPPPLRTEKEYPEAFLTKDGVIEWTNIQREKYGFLPLKENQKLNETAQVKLEDMFLNQYFGHYSPSGKGVADLVKDFDYQFLVIAENLALGDFPDDKTLVDDWLASPGHRANILNPHYQEIGVAVKKGVFEGKTTWMAVQHFGLSLFVCPQPNLVLKEKIEENQKQLSELEKTLSNLKAEIQPIRRRILEREVDFQKIEQYNNLVFQYNTILEENKTLINQYNSQINLFNQCVAEFSK